MTDTIQGRDHTKWPDSDAVIRAVRDTLPKRAGLERRAQTPAGIHCKASENRNGKTAGVRLSAVFPLPQFYLYFRILK